MFPPICARSHRGAPSRQAALLAACLLATGLTAGPSAGPSAGPTWPGVALEVDGIGVVGYLPLGPADRLGVTFIHSVDRLPVQDWYVLSDGSLVQDSTRLRQFGAGMGHIAGQGTGQPDGDWWQVSGIQRDIGTLVLRIGSRSVDHRLLHRGGEVPLSACWPGHRLTIRPAQLSAALLLAGAFPSGCE